MESGILHASSLNFLHTLSFTYKSLRYLQSPWFSLAYILIPIQYSMLFLAPTIHGLSVFVHTLKNSLKILPFQVHLQSRACVCKPKDSFCQINKEEKKNSRIPFLTWNSCSFFLYAFRTRLRSSRAFHSLNSFCDFCLLAPPGNQEDTGFYSTC